MTENSPNLAKDINLQFQEVEQIPYRKNPKKSTPRPSTAKLLKIKEKEKVLKTIRKKCHIIHKGTSIQMKVVFSSENMEAKRKWHNIFQVLKGISTLNAVYSETLFQK